MKKYSLQYKHLLVKRSIEGNIKKKKKKKRRIQRSTDKKIAKRRLRTIKIEAPAKFNLSIDNCDASILFVNSLKNVSDKYTHIEIILDNITQIGEGAIGMLLSVVIELGKKFLIRGTYPVDAEARDILEKSGFFRYVKGSTNSKNSTSKNTILKKGDFDTPPDEMASEIRTAMKTVWTEDGRNPLMYGGVFEMIRNSCDHAFRKKEKIQWYFSISHFEEENFVKFSFVDNGKGIVKTLTQGILKTVMNVFQDDSDLIETAFKNGIESRTGLSWRGKGLPTIYELLEDKVVNRLIVITNGVYIDFAIGVKHKLKYSYSGTYYYWEIDKNCKKYCFT